MSKSVVDHARLVELLCFEPETGVFRWRVDRHPGNGTLNRAGAVAGSIKDRSTPNSYSVIWIDGRLYRAHRLAWFYVHGAWPTNGIDHVNGNGLDNRICNLRECTQQQNNGNHSRLNRCNTSGLRGVTWRRDKGKWKAYINVNNKQVHLGYFTDKDAAWSAYCAAALAHFGAFARLDRAG